MAPASNPLSDTTVRQKLASRQAIAKAWASHDFVEASIGGAAAQNGPGFDPNAMMSELMSGKYGRVLPEDAEALISWFLDRSAKVSEMTKNDASATLERVNAHQRTVESLQKKMALILAMPSALAQTTFDKLKFDLAKNPPATFSPNELNEFLSSRVDNLPGMINLAKVESSIAAFHKNEAEALKSAQHTDRPLMGLELLSKWLSCTKQNDEKHKTLDGDWIN